MAGDELDEAFGAEELPLGVAGLGDRVGVEQEPVTGLEVFPADLGCSSRKPSPRGGPMTEFSTFTTCPPRTSSAGGVRRSPNATSRCRHRAPRRR